MGITTFICNILGGVSYDAHLSVNSKAFLNCESVAQIVVSLTSVASLFHLQRCLVIPFIALLRYSIYSVASLFHLQRCFVIPFIACFVLKNANFLFLLLLQMFVLFLPFFGDNPRRCGKEQPRFAKMVKISQRIFELSLRRQGPDGLN